jgi:hypothetical protein
MPDDLNNPESKRARTAGKKTAARKSTPSLLPILQTEPKPAREKFPFFLGAGIMVSIAVLVIVAFLSFCSHKSKPDAAPTPPPIPETTVRGH